MFRLTMCSVWLISLLACSSGNLKLVAILVLALFAIVWLTWYDLMSYFIVLPVSISALVFRLCSICHRCIVYARFMLYFCECLSYNFLIVLLFFHYSIFDMVWWKTYSIVLPVSISALVFRLWSICFKYIINEGYFGYSIGMKAYRACTPFD